MNYIQWHAVCNHLSKEIMLASSFASRPLKKTGASNSNLTQQTAANSEKHAYFIQSVRKY